MSLIEIKVPSPGESIAEVQLANWLVSDGDFVERDQEIAEIDSDKATLSISATEDGKIKLLAQEGDTIDVGSVVATVDSSVKGEASSQKQKPKIQEEVVESAIKEMTVQEDKEDTEVGKEVMKTELNISPLAKKRMQEKGLKH